MFHSFRHSEFAAHSIKSSKMRPSPIPPTDPPDVVPDLESDTVATVEGDNEYRPAQPLPPGTEPVPQRPRGNEPHTGQPLRKATD